MWNNQGFSQSGFGGEGGFGTPGADDRKKGVRRSTFVPVTVAQILTAKHDGDVFMSGNFQLDHVTFVGLIVAVNETPTRFDYSIDDMTGPPLDVRQFNNNSDENDQAQSATSAVPVNTYVRVSGQVRAFGGKRAVTGHKITPVTNMNELSCHMLEVIYVSSQLQGSPSAVFSGGDKKGVVAMETGNQMPGLQIPGLTPLQSQIQMIIRSDLSEGGCGLDNICQQLRTVAPKAIRDALEFLSTEGHIYSTIDEEHFKSLDS